jgi:flagellar biosynthesis protein FliQ
MFATEEINARIARFSSKANKQSTPRGATSMRTLGDERTARGTSGETVMGDLGADAAMALTSDMLWTAVLLAAPVIGVSTLVGLGVSILQVVTQIQESSLSFVPKLLAAVATLLLLGGWMLTTLSRYAIQVISNIPDYL